MEGSLSAPAIVLDSNLSQLPLGPLAKSDELCISNR